MKRLLFIPLLLLIGVGSNAQCIADAGKDTTICLSFGMDTLYLGGAPTVTGGIPPYTYTWSCTDTTFFPLVFYASFFLDDTTAANPQLINPGDDTLDFFLTVTDSLGNSCTDSVAVGFCQYVWTLDWKFVYIDQGDTAQICPSVGWGCPPLTFLWSPNYNISDPNVPNPSVWPDTTTVYYSTVTDAAGCQAMGGSFDVFVIATGINEQETSKISLYPNPTTGIFTIQGATVEIQIFDLFGRLVLRTNKKEVDMRGYAKGVYVLRVGGTTRKIILQ